MFVNAGARDLLLQSERQKFLAEQWPRISANIQRLGLTREELLNAAKSDSANSTPPNSKPPNEEKKS
jgi:GntR family transcriptional regulator